MIDNEQTGAKKRIAKNTIVLYIRMIVVMLISLYTTRVVLNALGVVDYGINNVVCGFVSMFAFLNTSMTNGIQRFYNFKLGKEGETIQIFNYGNCRRDFTYVDDIVEGVVRIMQHAPEKQTGEDNLPVPPYKVYNIGNSSPENLLDFVTILQEELIAAGVLPADYDFEAHKELVPMQPGDVPITYADTTPLERDFGFRPSTPLRQGLRAFAQWYAGYYKTSEA